MMPNWRPVPYWRNWHRMHSIRWNVLTLSCGSSLASYGAAYAISPTIVTGIPHWILTLLVAGTMIGPLLSSFGALTSQSNLPTEPPRPANGNDFHQGDTP